MTASAWLGGAGVGILQLDDPLRKSVAVDKCAACRASKRKSAWCKRVVSDDHRLVAFVVVHSGYSVADRTARYLAVVSFDLDRDSIDTARGDKVHAQISAAGSDRYAVALTSEKLSKIALKLHACHRVDVGDLDSAKPLVLFSEIDPHAGEIKTKSGDDYQAKDDVCYRPRNTCLVVNPVREENRRADN